MESYLSGLNASGSSKYSSLRCVAYDKKITVIYQARGISDSGPCEPSPAARTYSFRDQVSLDLRVSAKLARQGRRRRIETKRFLDDRLEILELLQAVSERVCEVE